MTISPQDQVYFRLLELGAFNRRATAAGVSEPNLISDAVIAVTGRAQRRSAKSISPEPPKIFVQRLKAQQGSSEQEMRQRRT